VSAVLVQEDVFVMRSDGSGLRRLTNDAYRDRLAQWSPDGTRIAFRSDRPRTGTSFLYALWTIAADGTGLRLLFDGAEPSAFRWSPDGSAIVVQGSGTLTLVAADGGDARVVAGGGGFSNPVWSPDGTRITYRQVEAGEQRAYVLDVSRPGSEPEALPARNLVPQDWSQDGSALLLSGFGPTGAPMPVVYDFATRTYEDLSATGGGARWLSGGRSRARSASR